MVSTRLMSEWVLYGCLSAEKGLGKNLKDCFNDVEDA